MYWAIFGLTDFFAIRPGHNSVNVGLVKREYTELSKTRKEFLYKKT